MKVCFHCSSVSFSVCKGTGGKSWCVATCFAWFSHKKHLMSHPWHDIMYLWKSEEPWWNFGLFFILRVRRHESLCKIACRQIFRENFFRLEKKPCSSQWMMEGIQHGRMKIRFAGKAVLRICRPLCQKNFVFCWKQFRKTPWISPIFERGSDCHVFSFGLVGHFACFWENPS